MQELIDKLKEKEMLSEFPQYSNGIKTAIFFAESLLPKERQQIIDFHFNCTIDGLRREGDTESPEDRVLIKEHTEQYYNETYGNENTTNNATTTNIG